MPASARGGVRRGPWTVDAASAEPRNAGPEGSGQRLETRAVGAACRPGLLFQLRGQRIEPGECGSGASLAPGPHVVHVLQRVANRVCPRCRDRLAAHQLIDVGAGDNGTGRPLDTRLMLRVE